MMELCNSFGLALRYLKSLIRIGAMSPPWQPNGPAVFPARYTLKRDWGDETILMSCEHYSFKVITMNPNEAGGLQYHHKKDEAGFVLTGGATVEYDPGNGVLVQHKIGPGDCVRFPQGAVHRMTAGPKGIDYIEVSTPYYNDRCHCEKEYGLEAETGGLPSTEPEDVTKIPPGAGAVRHKPWLLITDPQDSDSGC
jgi:mannose-6-phosphate isomerase-like protein (cupin superfamily)